MWVVFSGPLDAAGSVVTGTLYRTTGPALGSTFDRGEGRRDAGRQRHADRSTTCTTRRSTWSVDGMSRARSALVRQTLRRDGGSPAATTASTDGELSSAPTWAWDSANAAMPMPMPPTDMAIARPEGRCRSRVAGGPRRAARRRSTRATCSWTGDRDAERPDRAHHGHCDVPFAGRNGRARSDAARRSIARWSAGRRSRRRSGMGMGMSGCTRTRAVRADADLLRPVEKPHHVVLVVVASPTRIARGSMPNERKPSLS